MRSVDATKEQVPGKPTHLIIELCLVCHRRRTVGSSQIFCLHQLGFGIDLSDRTHTQNRGSTLVQQSHFESALIPTMGIPMAIQTAETRSGQGFVDRGVPVNPRITLGHMCGVLCKL